jgi:hypothetical protein
VGDADVGLPFRYSVVPTLSKALEANDIVPDVFRYPNGWSRVVELLQLFAFQAKVSDEAIFAAVDFLRNSNVVQWAKIADEEVFGRPVWDAFLDYCRTRLSLRAKEDLGPKGTIELRSSIDTVVLVAPPVSDVDLAGLQDCAEMVSGCVCTSEFADLGLAWARLCLEQVERLFDESAFRFAVFAGENWQSARFDNFSDFDVPFMAELTASGTPTVFAGGTAFEPQPETKIYVTGPCERAGPVLGAAEYGLVPPFRHQRTAAGVQAALRCLVEGMPCFGAKRLKDALLGWFPAAKFEWFIVVRTAREAIEMADRLDSESTLRSKVFEALRTDASVLQLPAADPLSRIRFTIEHKLLARFIQQFVLDHPDMDAAYAACREAAAGGNAGAFSLLAARMRDALLVDRHAPALRTQQEVFKRLASMASADTRKLRVMLDELAGTSDLAQSTTSLSAADV